MASREPDYKRIQELVLPLMVMEHDINKATRIRPTAIMLPEEVFGVPYTGGASAMGVPAIPGDRSALIYEAPKGRQDDGQG